MSVIERVVVEAPAVAPVTKELLLLHAANILDEFDWCQGEPGSRGEGAMCAVGAIWEAAADLGISTWDDRAHEAWTMDVEGYDHNEADTVPLARWNDEPGRTKAEVVAKLRAAADAA